MNVMMFSSEVAAPLRPKITVIGVGGGGGNAVNNMIASRLEGVDFLVCNTDAQALTHALTENRIQLGSKLTSGLGAGARPEVGRAAAEESIDQVLQKLSGYGSQLSLVSVVLSLPVQLMSNVSG